MENPVIIALDFENGDRAKKFLKIFAGTSPYVKVGMELYYAEGTPFIHWLKENGFKVFLDLKLHDIPTTVQKAMKVLGSYDIDIVNVHAAGGIRMMEAAKEGLYTSGSRSTKLIAVTQLTSTDSKMMHEELLIQNTNLENCVKHYAHIAKKAGLDGVVCSAKEASIVKEACGGSFLTVTPGIRLAGNDVHDQIRVATPTEAVKLGVDHMVIGRSITQAADPLNAYEMILKEWSEAYENHRPTFASY